MTSNPHVSIIEALAAQEFDSEESDSGDISSGPGYFLIDLLTSETFWDDDGTRAREVEEQYTAELVGLEAALTARWGQPRHLDIAAHLFDELPLVWSEFANCTADVLLWRADQRWVALAVGQHDQELPIRLFGAVTEIDPPSSG